MSHNLAKPKTASGGLVELIVDSDSTANDNLFRLKASEAQMSFSVQVADVTGDADVKASYTHNQMTRGTFMVRGYALGDDSANALINIHKLQDAANGGAPGGSRSANLQFNWSNKRTTFGIGLIEQIQISYTRSSPWVAVALQGRFTDTDMSAADMVDNMDGGMP